MNGDGAPSFLSQTLDTIIGRTYTLRFALGEEQIARPSPASVAVTFGTMKRTFTLGSTAGYAVFSLNCTATSRQTLLEFRDDAPGSEVEHSPFIDVVSVTVSKSPMPEAGAFVVLGGKSVAERKFDSDGDNIEVRGNGPFVSEAIKITRRALTIRAGAGFRPVIELNPQGVYALGLLLTDAPLVLEGLELRPVAREPAKGAGPCWCIVYGLKPPLYVANCRFVSRPLSNCITTISPVCELRNCEILCPDEGLAATSGLRSGPGQRLIIDNCVQTGGQFSFFGYDLVERKEAAFIQVTRNTFHRKGTLFAFSLKRDEAPSLPDGAPRAKLLRVEASGNLFDVDGALSEWEIIQVPPGKILPPVDSKAFLTQKLGWQGQRNLYAVDGPFLRVRENLLDPQEPIKSLADWKGFWGSAEANSMEGRVRYQVGDLLAKLRSAPEKLIPEDFRLRPDSPGYRAGKDGRDLGADVDLVGPGPAYERWKKTPEYQQWLKDSGQQK